MLLWTSIAMNPCPHKYLYLYLWGHVFSFLLGRDLGVLIFSQWGTINVAGLSEHGCEVSTAWPSLYGDRASFPLGWKDFTGKFSTTSLVSCRDLLSDSVLEINWEKRVWFFNIIFSYSSCFHIILSPLTISDILQLETLWFLFTRMKVGEW